MPAAYIWAVTDACGYGISSTTTVKVSNPNLLIGSRKPHSRYVRSRDGACYVEPAQDIRPLEQGFAFRFKYTMSLRKIYAFGNRPLDIKIEISVEGKLIKTHIGKDGET